MERQVVGGVAPVIGANSPDAAPKGAERSAVADLRAAFNLWNDCCYMNGPGLFGADWDEFKRLVLPHAPVGGYVRAVLTEEDPRRLLDYRWDGSAFWSRKTFLDDLEGLLRRAKEQG